METRHAAEAAVLRPPARTRGRTPLLKKRLVLFGVALLLLVLVALFGLYRFNIYWQHRFDPLIARHASFYNLDPALVWSVIYEETYFRPWMHGDAGEVGLMQVTPAVAREWAAETGLPGFARRVEQDTTSVLLDPERNIQIGCWYLEKISKPYRDDEAVTAKMLAAYNAGPSRAAEWSRAANEARRDDEAKQHGEALFIDRITFPTTKEYVRSIIARYRQVKAERGGASSSDETADDTARLVRRTPAGVAR